MKRIFRHSAQLALASTALIALAHGAAAADTSAGSVEQHSNDVYVQSATSNTTKTVTTNISHSSVTSVGDNESDHGNSSTGSSSSTTVVDGHIVKSDQDAADISAQSSHDTPAGGHKPTAAQGNNSAPSITSAASGGMESANTTVIASGILESNAHPSSHLATTMPQTPHNSASLPGTSPSTPSNNLPFNPLASTGLLLNLGQIGAFPQTLAKSFSTFIPATIASRVVGTVLSIKTKQILNWLLMVAAILMVGIVAMWRRSGYSHAPRAGLLNQFRLFSWASSGGIVSNSLFCVPNIGGNLT